MSCNQYCNETFNCDFLGSIAPETFEARCFTMLYGTLFCPLTWIIIRDLGQLALVYLTTVYARLKLRL